MSKKYFAKYLPVEGELNKDDLYFSYKNGLLYKWLPSQTRHEGDKKVKLFICSRNIQVGDICYPPKEEGFNPYIPMLCIEDDIEPPEKTAIVRISWGIEGKWYKVVGEISKDANWVKEYDEFNEQDIKHWCDGNTEGLTILCSMCRGVSDWVDCKKHIIKIKGNNELFY